MTVRGSPAGDNPPQDGTQSQGNAQQVPAPPQLAPQQPIQHDETNGQGDIELPEGQEPDFPHAELAKLDEMINKPRWVVPVLPKGELEVLLDAAIDLCKKGWDVRSEACQRFFKEGLTISFTKILTDDAVSGWKYEIHKCILKNSEKFVEVGVLKLSQDWFPLLDLLAMVFNPNSKFHVYNSTRQSETVVPGSQVADDELFARPPDARTPRGWLVDLLNKFGLLGGFQILLDRFTQGPALSVPVCAALVRPFGLCHELLTPYTVEKYFMPIIKLVPDFLNKLTDEDMKKESKSEAKNDALSNIVKALKCLASRVPGQEETVKSLEVFRLKMILRLLQISSYNGKMNALNEVNKVLTSVSYYSHRQGQAEEDEWLTADKMAEWIQDNKVLDIVLKDNLHQPQYVEKLEKILRFMIKEKALTLTDLDLIWDAQAGKHDAIIKNVHDLLAKLAWDFSPEQLDHLFECFQGSWHHAAKKQREKLLELIRRLAEDDKEGVMAYKVLGLLWNLAHSDDCPTDIMDQALSAHIKILDYSCSQDRDTQKLQWINKFVEELKNDKWVLPALKQIREICQLFTEPPQNFGHSHKTPHVVYRNQVINKLQSQHSIVMLVAKNLVAYMQKAKQYAKDHRDVDPVNILPDGRFNHNQQVQERLRFLRFLLKDGQLWLCEPQAKQIWMCLAENAIYVSDREACFRWFSKLMGEEPDLDPEITKEFFESNILMLDPALLTENGMNCFERFFKAVNSKENKLEPKRRGGFLTEDVNLIGLDYLWKVVLLAPDEVADKAIILLREIYTNLGPRLQNSVVEIHEDFLSYCMDRLRVSYDNMTVLEKDPHGQTHVDQESSRMIRVMTALREYLAECDDAYGEERAILPLSRACRGKHVSIVVRFPNHGRQMDDLEIWSHTNDTVGSIRRQILHKLRAHNSNLKVDLYNNGELLDLADDRKLVSQVPIKDKALITAKLCQVGGNMPSSPDSSSDGSGGSPHNPFEGPNIEAEQTLPGVLMAHNHDYARFFFQIADMGCQLGIARLRESARQVLKLMPADQHTVEQLKTVCAEQAKQSDGNQNKLEILFFGSSPSEVLYFLEVTYTLLMPANNWMSEDTSEFQDFFVRSGGVAVTLSMMTKNNFMSSADLPTKRSAYLSVLRICKLMLTTVGHAMVQVVAAACAPDSTASITPSAHNHAVVLQQALHYIPNPSADFAIKNAALKLGQQLADKATSTVPDLTTVKAIQKIAWSASSGCLHLACASNEDIHKAHEKPTNPDKQPDTEDIFLSREAMEVLTVCLALCPAALEALNKDKAWHCFIIDQLLLCRSRPVRLSAADQFFMMATKCSSGHRPLIFFITLLFTVLSSTAKDNAKQSHDYFTLLCRLLNYAHVTKAPLANSEVLLNNEITWLKRIRDDVVQAPGVTPDDALLEGHLGLTRELLAFQTTEKKFHLGAESGGANLIKELVEDFIFPASRMVLHSKKLNGELPADNAVPVCSSPPTIIAAYDLLAAFCAGCVPNLKAVADMLTEMYYSGHDPALVEWEYLPPVGPRPYKGFVGLKNAGATCYMNSVLQQLFMIPSIREGSLQAEGVAEDVEDEVLGDEKGDNETNIDTGEDERKDEEKPVVSKADERKDYNLGVLKHVQVIFGHLACSKLQYFVPRGFWKHFKLWGEPVNLREQHDALEFFNSLVDSLDEALKTLGQPSVLAKALGGSFADQKICKDCPHRYSREESFTTLNVDIRNHQHLKESLEQYVKGDLLEGANAYFCEKCNKKVDTVKRLCIKKLPPMLAMQLKRFDYDWER